MTAARAVDRFVGAPDVLRVGERPHLPMRQVGAAAMAWARPMARRTRRRLP